MSEEYCIDAPPGELAYGVRAWLRGARQRRGEGEYVTASAAVRECITTSAQAAVDAFAAMAASVEPSAKARLLCAVVDAACACVNEAYRRAGTVAGPEALTINADDLVGLFSYIVIHSDTSPVAQVAFLESFLDGEECIEMSGFLLTSLQVSCMRARARARVGAPARLTLP